MVIVFGIWWVTTATQRKIANLLEETAALASNSVLDSDEQKIEKSQDLIANFSETGVIDWQENGAIPNGELFGREEIYQKVLAVKNSISYQIDLSDIRVEILPGKKSAMASFNLVVTQRQNVLAWQAKTQLARNGKVWQISNLTLEPVLKK